MSTDPSNGHLVRLYVLQGEAWASVTTGKLRFANVSRKGPCLLITGEDDVVVMEFPISEDDIYQKQDDTLIVWCEQSSGEDLGISFMHAMSREAAWTQLTDLQARLRSSNLHLPSPNLANLTAIHELITCVSPDQKQQLGNSLLRGFYIDDLFDLASQLEEDEHLEAMFEIFLTIISLNHQTVTEYIMGVEWLPELIYVLSHDPNVPKRKRRDHRAFLQEKAKFKEVVPMPSPEVVELIHHSFMLQYLRDAIVIGILDDTSLSAVGTLILYANLKIFNLLQEDSTFFTTLMNKIQSCKDVEKLRDLAQFLQHYFDLPKGVIELRQRYVFFSKMATNGLFESLHALLSFPDEELQQTTIGLLLTTVNTIPNMLREFIMSDEQAEADYSFAESLVESFHTAPGTGEMGQFAELFRHLLDPCSMEEHRQVAMGASEALEEKEDEEDEDGMRDMEMREDKSETFMWEGKEEFLRLFYKKFMPLIVAPIVEPGDPKDQSHLVWSEKCEIADLMTYCLARHNQRIKFFILSHQILEHFVRLLPTAPGTLALAVVRFFRAAVSLADRYVDQRIMHKALFGPIVELFRANMHRYNMINSAILELFSFVSEDEYKNFALIEHLVERYESDFEAASYAPCLAMLVQKHARHKDLLENGDRRSSAGSKRGHAEAFPDEPDGYFDMLSDDEQSTPPLDGLPDDEEDARPEEVLALPSVKRRKKDDDDDDDDLFGPAASAAVPQARQPQAKGKGITFSWSLARKASDCAVAAAAEAAASDARAGSDSTEPEPAAPPPVAAAEDASV
mmetsp:Transcript_9453/g.38662  ORF Transcript_9453/g.38662 Transcript_9453/m.38662 type:complete len:793 (+) Transcript_9453:157-2535(+)